MTLLDVLSERPYGPPASGMTWDLAAQFLREHYLSNEDEKKRREKAARRQRFYMGGGDQDMVQFIRQVIKDQTVRQKRLEFVEHAKFNNVLRRVTHELATCYSLPAVRRVDGVEDNARYQALIEATRLDEVMRRANQLAVLHRNVVIMPRVRTVGGRKYPVVDVITPDCFYAVRHPNDPLSLVALVLDLNVQVIDKSTRTPAFIVWTATEWFYLDKYGYRFETPPTPHNIGTLPALLFSLEPPAGQLLDTTTGDDLEAAHRSTWFLGILLLKEAKSATKQHVISGDTNRTVRDQAADTDVPIEGGDGTAVTTIDNSMDLGMFIDTARAVYETAAANYGLSADLLRNGAVASADARELARVPLRELRLQQQVPFRNLERDLAVLMSKVIGAEMPEFAFSPDGWSIDFSDPQTPLGTSEALTVFEKERRLGLTSTLAEVMRRNPDLTREQALEVMSLWVEDETARVVMMKDLLAAQGTLQVAANPAADDEEVAA